MNKSGSMKFSQARLSVTQQQVLKQFANHVAMTQSSFFNAQKRSQTIKGSPRLNFQEDSQRVSEPAALKYKMVFKKNNDGKLQNMGFVPQKRPSKAINLVKKKVRHV